MSQKSTSKLTATQKIIRKKFKKAFTNRIKNENNTNHAIHLTTNVDLKPKNREFSETYDVSLQPHSHSTTKSSSNHAVESRTNKTNKKAYHDPNLLCNSLKILLAASLKDCEEKQMQQIKSILSEMRKLEIII